MPPGRLIDGVHPEPIDELQSVDPPDRGDDDGQYDGEGPQAVERDHQINRKKSFGAQFSTHIKVAV